MSKTRERAHFEWQKSFNIYMILLTLIIFLTTAMDNLTGWVQIFNAWILSFCIAFFGLAIISLNGEELIYSWKHLRDKRKKVSKLEKYSKLTIYLFIGITGLLVMLFGFYLMFVMLGVFPNPMA